MAVGSRRISTLYSLTQTVLQNVELKDADNADDDLFHTGVELLEDLDRTFLGDLADALDELLTLHGIHLTHSVQNAPVRKSEYLQMRTFLPGVQTCITDRENTRIKDTDDISGIGFARQSYVPAPSSAAAGKDGASSCPVRDKLPCQPQTCRNRYA